MRTLATLAATSLVLAGCTAGPSAVEDSPPVRHVAIARLPELPAHDPELPLEQPPGRVDRSDPKAVAAALIISGLAEQGLEVVDLGVEALPVTSAGVTVRVAATHRGGVAGASHTSVYELDLSRGSGGFWRLVGFRQAQ